jgi:hypothetical protein
MSHQLKVGIPHQMGDIVFAACKEIVNAKHIMARIEKPLAQVRTEKASTTGH